MEIFFIYIYIFKGLNIQWKEVPINISFGSLDCSSVNDASHFIVFSFRALSFLRCFLLTHYFCF